MKRIPQFLGHLFAIQKRGVSQNIRNDSRKRGQKHPLTVTQRAYELLKVGCSRPRTPKFNQKICFAPHLKNIILFLLEGNLLSPTFFQMDGPNKCHPKEFKFRMSQSFLD